MIEVNPHIPPEYAHAMAMLHAEQAKAGTRIEMDGLSGALHEARFALRFWRWRIFLIGDRGVVLEGWNRDFNEYQCPHDGIWEGHYVRVRHSNIVEVGGFAGDRAIDPNRIEGKAINRNPLVKRTRLFWKDH